MEERTQIRLFIKLKIKLKQVRDRREEAQENKSKQQEQSILEIKAKIQEALHDPVWQVMAKEEEISRLVIESQRCNVEGRSHPRTRY